MSKASILVVDDEQEIREGLELLLGSEGYRVFQAENAQQGLAALDREPVDLLLLDVALPDRNGLDLLREIRSKDPALPVILITAYGSIDMARQAFKAGALDYITKPWSNDELLAQVVRQAHRRQRCRVTAVPEQPRGRDLVTALGPVDLLTPGEGLARDPHHDLSRRPARNRDHLDGARWQGWRQVTRCWRLQRLQVGLGLRDGGAQLTQPLGPPIDRLQGTLGLLEIVGQLGPALQEPEQPPALGLADVGLPGLLIGRGRAFRARLRGGASTHSPPGHAASSQHYPSPTCSTAVGAGHRSTISISRVRILARSSGGSGRSRAPSRWHSRAPGIAGLSSSASSSSSPLSGAIRASIRRRRPPLSQRSTTPA
uniref:Response regulator n=1 Tax=Thermorudis peleae TaxID=1382356 RepID=A0A831X2C8_9BACT